MNAAVLGPAWPALLAPGLCVWRRGLDPDEDASDALAQYVVGVVGCDAFGRADLRGVWLHALDVLEDPALGLVPADSIQIDYTDPHTRDRVARALWTAVGGLEVADSSAPTFWYASGEWVLTGYAGPSREWTFRRRGKTAGDVVVAPGLVGIRFGTRHRDSLALRAAAAAVWGAK